MSLHADDRGNISTLVYPPVFDKIRVQEPVPQPDTFITYLQPTKSLMYVT
jgi:hypothetical protein